MIEVDDVGKSFGDVRALDGVSFTVGAGEILGLLGPNGAGKTTLVRILATLIAADRGVTCLGGVDVREEPARARRLLGLAGQSAALDELLTGRENLELIGKLYGLPRHAVRERAHQTLQRLDLTDAGDRRVGTYSGGMRRRLDLGATLIGEPSVILLDEPTAGLDPRSRAALWTLIDRIAADGATILLTSQYLDEVERLADRIVVINHGILIADAPSEALKHAAAAEVLEARVADDAGLEKTVSVLQDVAGALAAVDRAERRVSVPTHAGMPALIGAARQLDDASVKLVDLSIRRPSLDDVFFALTDETGDIEPIVVAREEPSSALAARPTARPKPVRDMVAITGRYLRRFARTPQMFIFGAIQPAAFVLGLQAAFGGLVERALGRPYIGFLLPGILVMNVILGASITSAGMAEDMQAGIIDRFRSLPMNGAAVLVGRTVADLVRYTIGLVVTLAVGYALGFRLHGTALGAAAAMLLLLTFSYAISWMSACVGLAAKSPQVAQLAGFLPALPLVYLSGAWIPVESMSRPLQLFARNQPVNVLVATIRSAVDGSAIADTIGPALLWTFGILATSVVLGVRLYRTRDV